jgi:hypothetical protein
VKSYLLIESRSDQESPDVPALRETAARLSGAGHPVTLFLVQNAVLSDGSRPSLAELLDAGVEVWIDEYSARARVPCPLPRPAGMRSGGMPELVRMLMTPGVVPVWH